MKPLQGFKNQWDIIPTGMEILRISGKTIDSLQMDKMILVNPKSNQYEIL